MDRYQVVGLSIICEQIIPKSLIRNDDINRNLGNLPRNWAPEDVLLVAARPFTYRPQGPRSHPILRDKQKGQALCFARQECRAGLLSGRRHSHLPPPALRVPHAWPDRGGQNTLVFGINPQNAESHREFRARCQFPFPLLVDEGQKVAALYNSDGGLVNRPFTSSVLTGTSVTPVAECRAPKRCWREQ